MFEVTAALENGVVLSARVNTRLEARIFQRDVKECLEQYGLSTPEFIVREIKDVESKLS